MYRSRGRRAERHRGVCGPSCVARARRERDQAAIESTDMVHETLRECRRPRPREIAPIDRTPHSLRGCRRRRARTGPAGATTGRDRDEPRASRNDQRPKLILQCHRLDAFGRAPTGRCRGAINRHRVAASCEGFGDLCRVVTDPAAIGRELRRQDVPARGHRWADWIVAGRHGRAAQHPPARLRAGPGGRRPTCRARWPARRDSGALEGRDRPGARASAPARAAYPPDGGTSSPPTSMVEPLPDAARVEGDGRHSHGGGLETDKAKGFGPDAGTAEDAARDSASTR